MEIFKEFWRVQNEILCTLDAGVYRYLNSLKNVASLQLAKKLG